MTKEQTLERLMVLFPDATATQEHIVSNSESYTETAVKIDGVAQMAVCHHDDGSEVTVVACGRGRDAIMVYHLHEFTSSLLDATFAVWQAAGNLPCPFLLEVTV